MISRMAKSSRSCQHIKMLWLLKIYKIAQIAKIKRRLHRKYILHHLAKVHVLWGTPRNIMHCSFDIMQEKYFLQLNDGNQ